MRIVVAIDDTDNLESRGTGEIASLIAGELQDRGWGGCDFVTRHQLFVHPDIPYTSHNSAMCFMADIKEGRLEPVIEFVSRFLEGESAPGSDPGLCVAVPDRLASAQDLVDFGRRAKREVLTMEDAFALARRTGAHLSPHGGTGQGVIGALAGAGLRLWGNDGRLKGSLDLAKHGMLRVDELLQHPLVDAVRCVTGETLQEGDLVSIGEKPKTVLLEGASVLLVAKAHEQGDGAGWQTLHRKQLRGY